MIDAQTKERLETFTKLFLEENANINLSALRTYDQCWVGNVLDSLALIDILDSLFVMKRERAVLDIGTGGGFPLFPLAIVRPDIQFVGIDAVRKKIDALERIKSKLNLTNVKLIVGRSEELAHHPELRERFDIVTARAVAPLSTLLEYSVPFATIDGKCVFWKSMRVADEQRESVTALKALHAKLRMAHEYELPADFGKRQLLIYEKNAQTEERYPREVGLPKKKPL